MASSSVCGATYDVMAAYHDVSDESMSGDLLSVSTIHPDPCNTGLDFDTVISVDSELSDRNLDFDSIDEDLGERMLDFNSGSSYSFDGSMSSIDEDLSDFNSASSSCHLDNSIESDMSDSVMDF